MTVVLFVVRFAIYKNRFSRNILISDWPDNLKSLWQCNWSQTLNNTLLQRILENNFDSVDLSDHAVEDLLVLGISSLQAFVQQNFVGPLRPDDDSFAHLPYRDAINDDEIQKYLLTDGEEINANVNHAELLAFAKLICLHISTRTECIGNAVDQFVCRSWFLRYAIVHQYVIDENTETLYAGITRATDELMHLAEMSAIDVETKSICILEIVQALLHYKRIWLAKEKLQLVRKLLNVEISVEGRLGVRTKYQEKPLPQLLLKISPSDETQQNAFNLNVSQSLRLPTLLQLDDDVRLERIQFVDEADNAILKLSNVEQTLILATFQYIQRSQPKDKLANEEVMPYLSTLLYQEGGPWPVRIAALLQNIAIESSHKRTVERSLRQCEEVLKHVTTADEVEPFQRLSYVYASFIRPHWSVRAQLADLMVSLGLIKSALDVYLHIQKWDSVISCYTTLDLNHKAAEVIRDELKKRETVELYCLLGDALDEKEWYEKAWSLSNERSGRAQRHLGCHFFAKKQYEAAIPHLEKSLSINSLQENVWSRLGYAALTLERWELAAKAYRHYTNIEPNGYESWNNLAKAYLNLGDKRRAHKILTEALRCNYDNWKVWENFLIVSIDTGNFEDVLNAHQRLTELKTRYLDKEILQITVDAIYNDMPDADGRPSQRLTKKALNTLAHLCVQYPTEGTVFELSAKLLDADPLLQSQKLQKAYRCYTQTQNAWTKTPESTLKALQVCEDLCAASLKAFDQRNDQTRSTVLSQLSSARLSAQGCIKAASESEWQDKCGEAINSISQSIEAIKGHLMSNL